MVLFASILFTVIGVVYCLFTHLLYEIIGEAGRTKEFVIKSEDKQNKRTIRTKEEENKKRMMAKYAKEEAEDKQ